MEDKPFDFWHSVLKFFDHERGKIIGFILGVVVVLAVGCQPVTTIDPFGDDAREVTSQQLMISATQERESIQGEAAEIKWRQDALKSRIEAYNEAIEAAEADITQKIEQRQAIFDWVGGAIGQVASGGALNPMSMVTSALSLGVFGMFGGHSLVDARRKNKRIETLKDQGKTA